METGTLKIGDRVMIDPAIIDKEVDPSTAFEVDNISDWNTRYERVMLKEFSEVYGYIHPSWLKLVEPEEVEMDKTITESDFEALVTAVFDKIACLPCYDENNEPQVRGIGEMGDTRDEAKEVIKEWMEAQNIKLID